MQRSDVPRWSWLRLMLDRLRGSLFTVPIIFVIAAVIAVIVSVRIDEAVQRDSTGGLAFTGGPESARAVLSAIASSMLSLTALVFSVQIVTLQLTSSQFSPRALRNFLRDRTSQFTLGVFLATFAFSLMTLREVRGEAGIVDRFVPGLTVTAAFGLVALSVVLFINYIHHSAQSIRVVNIISRIAGETVHAVRSVYPEEPRERLEPPDLPRRVVPAKDSAVIQAVEERRMMRLAAQHDLVIWVDRPVGEFVPAGAPLLRVAGPCPWGPGGTDEDRADEDRADEDRADEDRADEDRAERRDLDERLVDAVITGVERTMNDDPAFGLRQLVDIAERALSPGINDPTTAVQCIDQIHAILRLLAVRFEPNQAHADAEGVVRLIVPVRPWDELVRLGFDEIRHWGANSIQIHRRLTMALTDLVDACPPERRRALVEQQRLLRERLADLPPVEQSFAGGPPA